MNLTLPIKQNRNALTFVTGCISRTSTLLILSCIRLRADAENVIVTATDLDVTLTAVLETETPFPAIDAVVNGKTFLGLFKRDKNLIVEGEAPKGAVVIAVNGSRFTVPTMDLKGFPVTPKVEPSFTLSVNPAALDVVLKEVEVAISSDESRYVLNGVYFEDGCDGTLNIVATDGRRLHRTACLVSGDAFEHGFILPSKAVLHLHKLLKEQATEGAPVKVEVDRKDNRIRFTGARLTMISKLIDGNFPNYRQVIPADDSIKHRIEISVPEWITALEAVLPFSEPGLCKSVKITLEHHVATFTVRNPDLGTGTATVAINWPKDRGAFSICFDPPYLIDALAPHKEASYAVHLGFIDELQPVTVSTATTTTVVMPMRLS